MLLSTNNIKMRQAIMNKNQTMPSGQKPVLHKSPGKRGHMYNYFLFISLKSKIILSLFNIFDLF